MNQQKIITENFLWSGKPDVVANRYVTALDITTGTLYQQQTIPYGNIYKAIGKSYYQPVSSGGVQSIVPGTNITVDNTDPLNPIVSASGGGSPQTLEETLDQGNTTSGNDIEISAGDHIIFDDADANTIAIWDASRNLQSAPASTYPSLTELSYVKGVTSSIQAQLTNKIMAYIASY